MPFPFDVWSVSLWFAVTGIILSITSQLVSVYDGEASILIDEKKLRTSALVIGMLFLMTVAMRIYGIVTA